MTWVGPVLDGALALALLGAAIMIWRLDRRLAALKASESGALAAAARLAEAVAGAQAAIAELKAAGEAAEARQAAERAGSEDARFLLSALKAARETPKEPARQGRTPSPRAPVDDAERWGVRR